MVQEHWLYPSTLSKLNISSEYVFFGSSAMGEKLSTGPFYGRPYGGTAILIKKDLSHFVTMWSLLKDLLLLNCQIGC